MKYDVVIIGGGPAGLSAACAFERKKCLLIEREGRLGGILKQCVHDGFGVIRYGEKLTGPEYAERLIDQVLTKQNVEIALKTFVVSIEKEGDLFRLTLTSASGMRTVETDRLIMANGCRERTPRQVGIHGTRPAGLMTAGVAQNFVNLMGLLPTKRCVILGSGDIGLIMARRLTLEGAEVVGVYEAKQAPSGLARNISQCLNDFGIPLYLGKTVTRVFGDERVTGCEIASVDEGMQPVAGTEERIACDAVIVSVGLIPENELSETLGVPMDGATKGATVDQNMQTEVKGVYSVGNCLHVHDLVDYVSETAETAARAIERERSGGKRIAIGRKGFLYFVPQAIDTGDYGGTLTAYFRSAKETLRATLKVIVNGEERMRRRYRNLKPPEAEKLTIELPLAPDDRVEFELEEERDE